MRTTGLLIVLTILIGLSGCNMDKWCAKNHPPATSKDSSSNSTTTLIKHDTILKPDSSSLVALISCKKDNDSLQARVISSQSGHATAGIPKLRFVHDTLYVDCPPLDTAGLYVQWYNKIVKENSNVTTVKTNIQYSQTNWQTIMGYLGYILIGELALAIILFIVWLVVKLK